MTKSKATMKTFREFVIEEIQWQQSLFDHLFTDSSGEYRYLLDPEKDSYWIPISTSMMSRLGYSERMTAFHVTGIGNLGKIIDIEGRRGRQLSVFLDDDGTLVSMGVHGGAGIVVVLEGDVNVGAPVDILSKVDKQGRRLIDIGPRQAASLTAHSVLEDNITRTPEYKKMWKELVDERKRMLASLTNLANKNGQQYEKVRGKIAWKEEIFTGQQKAKAIRDYIDMIEGIIKKYPKVFTKIYYYHVQDQKNSPQEAPYGYDELVMGNFKIVRVFVITDHDFESWWKYYLPEDGVYCREESNGKKSCEAIDFPIEFAKTKEVTKRLKEIAKSNKG